eukprot:2473016-Alexandrium_andersonii.AAC.1
MSASLVGSEMCIRDSSHGQPEGQRAAGLIGRAWKSLLQWAVLLESWLTCCLLYTSDAADDM